jgi:hypothetical protein
LCTGRERDRVGLRVAAAERKRADQAAKRKSQGRNHAVTMRLAAAMRNVTSNQAKLQAALASL